MNLMNRRTLQTIGTAARVLAYTEPGYTNPRALAFTALSAAADWADAVVAREDAKSPHPHTPGEGLCALCEKDSRFKRVAALDMVTVRSDNHPKESFHVLRYLWECEKCGGRFETGADPDFLETMYEEYTARTGRPWPEGAEVEDKRLAEFYS